MTEAARQFIKNAEKVKRLISTWPKWKQEALKPIHPRD